MPTREEILAELDRRKSASAPGGLSPEAIRAELARRAAMQAAAPSINRPSMGFDPVGEAARGMQKPMMDAMGSAVLGRPLPAPPAPPVDPLAPKGGWLPGQQQQQQARVADPGNPFNPRNAGRPDTGPPPPPDFGTLAEKAAKSVGGMIGGQRPESEAMAQFGGSVVTDPVGAANTAIEVLDPFHQAAYAYNDADAALKAGVTGDWKRAGNELKDLSQSGSFAAMSFLPGAEFAGAPGRMARAAGVAPKAAGAMASAAPEAVAAQVAPKPPQPMFTGPPGPAPSKGNFIVRRADQIVGGAVGATVGGTGDAIAAPGDGGGEEGGPPMGAISGAAIGIFGPRALANASSRGFRAAARPFRGGASFDERVAAKAVREALRSAGIRSADEAAAQMAARYGDKPAAVADLTQEGIGTAAGLSRLPGKTGEAAKARNADLLENRSGRLFTDIEGTTGIDPASVTKSIDDAIRQASEEISPAYEEMFAASRGVNSERLMQLMDDPVVAPYLRRAVQASESLATTAGQAPSNARTWDLVKRGLDRVIEGQIRTSGQAAPELMSARQAVRDELDGLIPEYKSIRDNADAPRMRAARKEGANAMGGRLSVEKVKKIASGLTGRPLTAMQAGMIEQLVPGIEKGQGITALASGRTEQALAAAFGEETARNLVARVRADAALTQNASRINPNVGSVTSQAGMGGGGVGGMIAGAVRAVRNPTEAGLSWLSKSGAYSKQQRDIMGEMLLEGTTPENLQRIFRGRGGPTAPRPQGPPRSAPRPPEQMGFGVGSSKGLRAAAIRYKGKVFSAETHDQALLDAEAAGVPIGKERIEEGFIGSNGKFVDRSDPNAALDALSAGQISDPTFRRMIEDKIRRGEAVSLVSDQVKLGSSKSLPMDEASRMGRRKEWQAEKGPVEDKTWFHSDSQGFDSVDPTKGELGLHVGDKFAADLISHRTKRARRWSSEDGRVAEPNMHEMFVRGNFASAPDLHNFASPLRYLEARMSPSKAAEFDSRYDKMWKQLDEQAREIYSRNGDDPAAWKSWRDAVHTSARDNKISGWEYANQYEAGVSRVIFDPTAARRTDATFDPSQSGSSKLLAGMGASPEAVGGIGGGVAGYFGAQDTNDDGVVDASERAAQGLGGLASGVVGAKIARTGVNKARGAFKPQSELMAAKGSYGARPSAMGDLTGHQAAQKQLKELETYRKTAPASEHAAVDQEIADLRQFLEGNGLGKRMVAGGAIGGIAGLAGTAESQTPETSAKIADNAAQTDAILADIKKIESDMRAYEGGDPLEMQKTLNRRSTDGSFIQEDGNIGPETTAAIARDKTAALAALKEKRERLTQLESTGKELEKQAAFERTRPTDDQQAFRDYAPLLGGIAGATGAKLARIGGTTVSKFTAKSSIKKANSLLSNAPISPPKTVADRAAIRERATNINEFWHRGGAKTKVPFESKRDGTWVARPTKDVTPPSALFPDKFVGRKVGAMDALIGGSSATEAVLAGQNAEIIKDKLKTAYETANEDPSEKNLARVQELEDQYAQAKGLMMLGIGAGIGTGIGVMTSKYASKRANIQLAEQELSILRQHFASQKKQGSNLGAKSKPKSSTTPPLPPSRPRKTQRPPNP